MVPWPVWAEGVQVWGQDQGEASPGEVGSCDGSPWLSALGLGALGVSMEFQRLRVLLPRWVGGWGNRERGLKSTLIMLKKIKYNKMILKMHFSSKEHIINSV